MKFFIQIIFCILLSSSASAHAFYFAYAEVEYNEISQKLEATIECTSHDLEKALSTNVGFRIDDGISESEVIEIEEYVNATLSIKSIGEEKSRFNYIGMELSLNGVLYLYFESERIVLDNTPKVLFSFLMDSLPEQQNKLTFIRNGKQVTLAFLKHEQSKIIENLIENE